MTNPDVRSFRLDAKGLERVLGELEAALMERLWAAGEATIGDIHRDIVKERDLAFNTVMTVMNRLVDKGLLAKRRRGRRHVYRPVKDRQQFLEDVSRQVARGFVQDFGDYAVAQFATALAEEDPEKLDELERLVADWQAKRR